MTETAVGESRAASGQEAPRPDEHGSRGAGNLLSTAIYSQTPNPPRLSVELALVILLFLCLLFHRDLRLNQRVDILFLLLVDCGSLKPLVVVRCSSLPFIASLEPIPVNVALFQPKLAHKNRSRQTYLWT